MKLFDQQLLGKNLDIIALGLQHFREANRDDQIIINRVNAGLNIRILSLNPNLVYVTEQKIRKYIRIEKGSA